MVSRVFGGGSEVTWVPQLLYGKLRISIAKSDIMAKIMHTHYLHTRVSRQGFSMLMSSSNNPLSLLAQWQGA